MSVEEEMSLPYLVFRTWRNYYDELLKSYELIMDEEYQRGRKQFHRARKSLLDAKQLFVRRGMTLDDDWITEVDSALLDNLELTHSLSKGDHAFLRKYMHVSLDMVDGYKDWASKKL